MATVLAQSSLASFQSGLADDIEVDSYVTQSAAEIVWETANGNRVRLTSSSANFTFAAGAPTGGTVQAIDIDTDGNGIYDLSIEYGVALAIVTELIADKDRFWRAAMQQADSVELYNIQTLQLGLDFADILVGQGFFGQDDVVDIQGDFATLFGDALNVFGALTGGDDQFTVSENGGFSFGLTGDTFFVANGATGAGGNDIINDLSTTPTGSRVYHGDFEIVSGDADGGADSIFSDVAAASVTGDAQTVDGTLNAGTDTLLGGDGSDTIWGDVDQIDAGGDVDAVSDTISGGGGDDLLYGDAELVNGTLTAGSDSISGGEGNDQIWGDARFLNGTANGAGDDTIDGGGGSDIVDGDRGNDSVSGGLGTDLLAGSGGNDTLGGGNANDTISGGIGADSLTGGNQIDTLDYSISNAAVTVNLATGAASGGHATGDTISGFENIIGSASADTLTGNSSVNIIEGGASGDTISGGGAADYASYAGSASAVTVDLGANTASGGDAAGDVLSSIENLIGSANADTLTGTGAANIFAGGAGGDTISGGGGIDTANYSASAAAVSINLVTNIQTGGDAAGDSLSSIENVIGSAFNDTIRAGAATETLSGGAGDDEYVVNSIGDDVVEQNGGGFDLVRSTVDFTLGAFVEDLLLQGVGSIAGTGNGLANEITGNNADNLLAGGAGIDTFHGGLGVDTVSFADQSIEVILTALDSSGNGTADVGAETETLTGIENLVGSGFADFLGGSSIANRIDGGGDGDAMYGFDGADTLVGSEAGDLLYGGRHNDTYILSALPLEALEELNEGYDIVETGLSTWTLADNFERVNYTGAGNFVGLGNDLDNRFAGNVGDDRFVTSLGADIYSGGSGSDSVDYRSTTADVILDFVGGTHAGAAAGDTFASIEKYFGSNTGGDQMTGDGAARFSFSGFGGNDALIGSTNIDALNGGAGADTLSGLAGRDTLHGEASDDTLTGGADGDYFLYVATGFGADTITDFEDGLDTLKVFSAVANDIADFTIVGNSTTSVTLSLNGFAGDQVTLNAATAITISAADFVFY